MGRTMRLSSRSLPRWLSRRLSGNDADLYEIENELEKARAAGRRDDVEALLTAREALVNKRARLLAAASGHAQGPDSAPEMDPGAGALQVDSFNE